MAGDTPQNSRDPNFDVALTNQSKLTRWNREVDPTWIHAVEQVAPLALTNLITIAVTAGTTGFIYGFFISATEANNFFINWVSGGVTRTMRIPFAGSGAVENVDPVPMNEGLAADASTNITVQNVNAGGVGSIYQARLLYTEV
jgi:hypothetical protein